ncbi:MAG: radical SAM protein [Lachnospiraceae bacterium]|nr:radical SAM protein [Lachnospiraceae bacterium]
MYHLRTCVWEITLACCFSCKYCGSRGGKAREGELSTEECLAVAEQLAELGCQRVSMIGGEVFMRKDWKQIVGRLSSLGINVNIITNGFLFHEDLIRDLREVNVESVSVSIDGPEEVHDRYRQPGSFKRALDAVAKLSEAGIPVSVISTLNSENVKGLEEMYSIMKGRKIYAWQLQACSPMGNAAESGIDFRFDMGDVINFVTSHMREVPFALGVADNIGYFTEAEGSIRGNMSGKAVFRGCSAGLSAIGIDSVGNVRGCESMYDPAFNEGNLREKTLKEIWEDPDAFAYNRRFTKELLSGKCAECRYGEYCGGGCRSYNHFVHGKLYESPFCARVKQKEC